MNKTIILLFTFLLTMSNWPGLIHAATFPKFSLDQAIRLNPNLAHVPNQRLIQFRQNSNLSPKEQETIIRNAGGNPVRRLKRLNTVVAYFPAGEPQELKRHPDIALIENDGYMELSFLWAAALPQGCAPSEYNLYSTYCLEEDTQALKNKETDWGHDQIGGERAWTWTQGEGIKVCVVDSGVDLEHPELLDVVTGGKNFSASAEEPDDDIDDVLGHGTHVSGIIAAASDDAGVAGVAPQIDLYMARVFGALPYTQTSMVIAGIEYCAEIGADIISMSLGGSEGVDLLEQAVNDAHASGAVIVAAAGNGYSGPVSYPAAYNGVIAVSASDINNELAVFSNIGPEVDLIAPGVDVYSTVPLEQGGYESYDGTSMATPYVAGVAALVRALNPSLSNDAVEEILKRSAKDIGLEDVQQGAGLVQACAATQLTNNSSGNNTDESHSENAPSSDSAEASSIGSIETKSMGPNPILTSPENTKDTIGSVFGN